MRLGYRDPMREALDREDQKAEEAAERKALRRAPVDSAPEGLERFGGLDPEDPEFESIETFVEFLFDNDRGQYTHSELMALNARLRMLADEIKVQLGQYGLSIQHRAFVKQIRGIQSNPNAGRFEGMCGGGGGTSIIGIAGQAG